MKATPTISASLAALILSAIACQSNTGASTGSPEPGEAVPASVDALPAGDPVRGEAIFAGTDGDQSLSCNACHTLDGTGTVGPSLQGVSALIPEGYDSTEAYLFESIIHPDVHLVEGYQDIMPKNFGERIDAQSLADLIAFLSQQ